MKTARATSATEKKGKRMSELDNTPRTYSGALLADCRSLLGALAA